MLFDPRWESDLSRPSIRNLVAWLETQAPETEYCFVALESCLLAQAFGGSYSLEITLKDGSDTLMGEEKVMYEIAAQRPQNFGAALKRARRRM